MDMRRASRLTSAFETIDKAPPQEFSAGVRHAPSTNDANMKKHGAECPEREAKAARELEPRQRWAFFESSRCYRENRMTKRNKKDSYDFREPEDSLLVIDVE